MVIFHSYVRLPEGKCEDHVGQQWLQALAIPHIFGTALLFGSAPFQISTYSVGPCLLQVLPSGNQTWVARLMTRSPINFFYLPIPVSLFIDFSKSSAELYDPLILPHFRLFKPGESLIHLLSNIFQYYMPIMR